MLKRRPGNLICHSKLIIGYHLKMKPIIGYHLTIIRGEYFVREKSGPNGFDMLCFVCGFCGYYVVHKVLANVFSTRSFASVLLEVMFLVLEQLDNI